MGVERGEGGNGNGNGNGIRIPPASTSPIHISPAHLLISKSITHGGMRKRETERVGKGNSRVGSIMSFASRPESNRTQRPWW